MSQYDKHYKYTFKITGETSNTCLSSITEKEILY